MTKVFAKTTLVRLSAVTACAVALAAVYWWATVGTMNLEGICSLTGRYVTKEEIRQRWTNYINREIALDRVQPRRSSLARRMLDNEFRGKRDLGEYEISDVPANGAGAITIHLFPDIPDYVGSSWKDIGDYHRAVVWKPVPLRYRITGYAFYLVFVDVKFEVKTLDGKLISQRIDYRSWVNSCGDFVSVPDEYIIG